MNHIEFNELFDHEFADPLIEMGFTFVRKTKSLRYMTGTHDLWIMRINRKWPHPGVAKTAICFRHSFLRPVSSDDPDSENLIIDDFPRKLTFEDFDSVLKPRLKYRPEHTGRWATSDLPYADQPREIVKKRLRKMRKLAETRILPWVISATEDREFSQISKHGTQVWCETRWIEDYAAFLSTQS